MLEGLRFQKLDDEVTAISRRMDTLSEQLVQTQVCGSLVHSRVPNHSYIYPRISIGFEVYPLVQLLATH